MEKKVTVKVDIPEGYDLIINGTDCKLVPKSRTPKTWEEFCKTHPIQKGECFIGTFSNIVEAGPGRALTGREDSDKLMLPNEETAEAFLALMQLIQLRNCYNNGWEPDWTDVSGHKYVIINRRGELVETCSITMSYVLAFRTEELRAQFLKNFRDLIEIAKPLI